MESNKVQKEGDTLTFFYQGEESPLKRLEMTLTLMRSNDDLSGVYNLTVPNFPDFVLMSVSDYQIKGCRTNIEYVARDGKIDIKFIGEGIIYCY